MNQVIELGGVASLLPSRNATIASAPDPIEAAARAIEQILATAHEAGQEEAVRLLHAVTALLSAAPRH